MIVDRCVCCHMTFEHLLALGRKHSADAAQVCESTGCGKQCTLCVAYIYKAFQTNNPRVSLMSQAEADHVLAAVRTAASRSAESNTKKT